MPFLIAGLVLLAAAAGGAWFARRARAHAREATTTETLTCAELAALAGGVGAEVGGGAFRQRCEVVGQAAADGDGAQAPESGTDAVWHRTQVTHRYWEMERRERDGKTHWDRVEHSETVSDISSELAFLVDDGSGQVLVAPAGAKIDRPEKVVDRFDQPRDGGGSGGSGLLDSVRSGFLRSGDRSGTIGFQTEEWIIRPGARLYVHGEAADASGRLRFADADRGRYVISTRSEEELVGEHTRNATFATAGAVAAVVGGLALVVVGLLGLAG